MADALSPQCMILSRSYSSNNNLTNYTAMMSVTQVSVTPRTSMSEEECEDFLQAKAIFKVFTDISKSYLWILFVLGFPGNVAAIVTIFRMRSCMDTFPIFVVMLAVMDSVAILVKLLFYQLLNFQVDIGTAGCCFLRFLGSWSSAYCSWILVFMALERFVAVRFPLKMTFYNGSNAYKVVIVLSVVGLVIAIIYLPQLWTSHLVLRNVYVCEYTPSVEKFMNNEYFWISTSVYAYLPFCLLTVFNFLIARQIRISLQVRNVMRNVQMLPYSHGCFDLSIQRQVNLMLLSATVVFVLLTFPICIYMVADAHWKVTAGYTRSTAVKFLCQQIAFVLVDSTHAINFYLYFLSARRFRHHFLRLITCKNCNHYNCSFNFKSPCRHKAKEHHSSQVEQL